MVQLLDAETGLPVGCYRCGKPATGSLNVNAVMASSVPSRFEPVCEEHNPYRLTVAAPRDLKHVVCPQCQRPFVLTWQGYSYDEETRRINSGDDSTLVLRGCPSGGIYDVQLACPHCDYEEPL